MLALVGAGAEAVGGEAEPVLDVLLEVEELRADAWLVVEAFEVDELAAAVVVEDEVVEVVDVEVDTAFDAVADEEDEAAAVVGTVRLSVGYTSMRMLFPTSVSIL